MLNLAEYRKHPSRLADFLPWAALISEGVVWQEAARFPLIVRSGTLTNGNRVRYLLNYSREKQNIPQVLTNGTDILTGRQAASTIEPWGVAILESSR